MNERRFGNTYSKNSNFAISSMYLELRNRKEILLIHIIGAKALNLVVTMFRW